MGNVATSIDKQIEILNKRGLILDLEEPKIKEVLLDIGYYRLGFYWRPFEKDKEHNFKENTKFSDILALYYFDVDLRNILNKYLTRIEINFRTKLIYYVSNKEKNSPTWFADQSVVQSSFVQYLHSIYNFKFKQNNSVIKKHHKKYINDKYAPAWKTLEFFTFGTNLNLFRSLKDKNIQKRISVVFGISDPNKFQNIIGAMHYLRNKCAHGDTLYDTNLPQGLPNLGVFDFNKSDRQSICACHKVLVYLIGHISNNRKKELEAEVKDLLDSHMDNENICTLIATKMKFTR